MTVAREGGMLGSSQHDNGLTTFKLRQGREVSVGGTTVMLIHELQGMKNLAEMRVEPRATRVPFRDGCFLFFMGEQKKAEP